MVHVSFQDSLKKFFTVHFNTIVKLLFSGGPWVALGKGVNANTNSIGKSGKEKRRETIDTRASKIDQFHFSVT